MFTVNLLSGKGYTMDIMCSHDFCINVMSSIYWCIWPLKMRSLNGEISEICHVIKKCVQFLFGIFSDSFPS